MARRRLPPFETEIETLGPKGVGVGTASDGRPVHIRGVPPGSRIYVRPAGRRKGIWRGRRIAMVRPPAAYETPPCAVFGLCGGCLLQELSLDAQRLHKQSEGQRMVAGDLGLDGVTLHEVRGAPDAYGYRNKVELSFGPRRYLSEVDKDRLPIEGRFLGFHAPGRFDRVVDAERCELISEPMNALIQITRDHTLSGDLPLWDNRKHEGFWRFLVLREARATNQQMAAIFTTTATTEAQVAAVQTLGEALVEHAHGVLWVETDRVADVARGETRQTWGSPHLEEHLGDTAFQLSLGSFFQTSTRGAEVLYDTVGEALGDAGGTLFDLYCGIGSIGLYLRDRFDGIVGIEEVESAVSDARDNAARNGVENVRFVCAKVEEVLETLDHDGRRALVVDPPRAGLHPKVAKALSTAEADVLVYVACKASSLGRDRAVLEAGGWRLTDLWTVDLFPHTGHVEMIGRFVR